MDISKHAELRIKQRGISKAVLDYVERFLPFKYENQSNKVLLTRKIAKSEAKKLRNIANTLEKHAGTEFLFDPTGSVLITVYRKASRK
tara:strand:- start:90 stop:353 length:264 start_codon:yes stop_codon:yes gene_type:complete